MSDIGCDIDFLKEYREKHPERQRKKASVTSLEDVAIGRVDGLDYLTSADDGDLKKQFSEHMLDAKLVPPEEGIRQKIETPGKKFIWVIKGDGFRVVVEQRLVDWHGEPCASVGRRVIGPDVARRSVCHTNLAGCEQAYCGGEMWLVQEDGSPKITLLLNGCSGRFPPYAPGLTRDRREYSIEKDNILSALLELYPENSSQTGYELAAVAQALVSGGFRVRYVAYDHGTNRWGKYPRRNNIVEYRS